MMNHSVLQGVRQVAADVFGVPVERITPESSPDSLEAWDSLQHLNFVLALEQAFEVEFEPEEMERMRSVEQSVRSIEEIRSRRQPEAA